jgi:zinc and cadmium transporter
MSNLILYCVFVFGASLFGGEFPSIRRMTHSGVQKLLSVVAGLMLGIALFHMLPHAAAEVESLDVVMAWVTGGLLSTFFLIRAFHFHQHGPEEDSIGGSRQVHEHEHDHDHGDGHGHHHDRGDPHPSNAHGASPASHRFSWVGIALGLTIHSLLDGAALAASIRADAHTAPDSNWLGFGIFLAVFFHKPLDAMSITALMATAGQSRKQRFKINVLYSFICPLGAVLFWFGTNSLQPGSQAVIGYALAFFAGVFLCISLSDLLPEVQFHSHDRLWLSALLLIGVTLAWSLRFLEGPHAHRRPGAVQQQQQGQ